MIYEEINYLSLIGKKKINKFNDKIRIKKNLNKNKEISYNNIVDVYINKSGIGENSNYEKNKEKKFFKNFFHQLYDYQIKKKEDKQNYISKLKGYKNPEEEKQIKEKRKKRIQEIIRIKKKKEFLDNSKICPNYKEIYSTLLPHFNYEKSEHKNKEENLTDRKNTVKINKINSAKIINDNFFLVIPTLQNLDKINNNKKFKSFETSKSNRIINITNKNNNTSRVNNDNILLSARNQIRLFNIKLKKKKISFLSNSTKKFLDINDKTSSINKSNDIHKENDNKINNNIDEHIFNSNISLCDPKNIKRSKSSFIIRNNKDNKDINQNNYICNRKKSPIQLVNYKKKWDLPKSIIFDKIVGRYDNNNKKGKVIEISGIKNYFPNYNSIFIDNKKSFVHYGKNKEMMLKNLKIETTRKLISNLHNLMNSPTNSYKVMDIIARDKQKKKEEKINKLKKKFGQYYEIAYKIKKSEI